MDKKARKRATVPVDQLRVDHEAYQRFVKPALVQKIVGNFNPVAFGPLLVGRRQDGSMWVVDGQNRLEAAKAMGFETVVCDVFDSRGRQDEAQAFTDANTCSRISTIDHFRARLIQGERIACEVDAALGKYGLEVALNGKGTRWPRLCAVGPLLTLCDKHGAEAVQRVVLTIVNGLEHDTASLHMTVIGGLCEFFSKWPEAQDQRLIDVLKRRNARGSAAAELIKMANKRNDAGGGAGRQKCAGRVLFDWYNYRLQKALKLQPIT